ncbi:VWA domain-containing protein [Terriglobus sp.]|uniref:VWA domain-containing protein n=1 Tax=Terriglobus sp. TaxID=1889013 RepID=UPI003AFFF8E2
MLRLTAACAALALSLTTHAQEPASGPETTPTIKVDTRLVMVPVIVRDKKGQIVRDLKQTDFTLSENNKPQSIRYFDKDSEAPLTVGLLVDVSGSQRNVLDEERTASSAFLDTLLRPDKDKAFLVQFGHQTDLLADVTGSLPRLEAGLKKIDADKDRPQFSQNSQQDPNSGSSGDPNQDSRNSNGGYDGRGGRHGGYGGQGSYRGGGTVLYDAIYLSSNDVIQKSQAAAQKSDRKALILLTDGDDRGSKESISAAIEAAQRANTTVYAIYFKGEERSGGGFPGGGHRGGMGGGWPGGGGGGGGWPGGGGRGNGGGQGRGGEQRVDGKKILERIADETGGRVFEVTGKQHIDDIYRQISEELRSEYRLGFTPQDTSDGYHRILIDLPNDKKSTIQARDGYYIGTAQ